MRWVVATSVLLLGLFIGGCGLIDGLTGNARQGDCLTKSGDHSFSKVSCSDLAAGYIVLDRADSGMTHDKCVDVAGTQYVYHDNGTGSVCVGTKGTDASHAVNAAEVGDCLTATSDSIVHKVDCADRTAVSRVLKRLYTPGYVQGGTSPCHSVEGTVTEYSYVPVSDSDIGSIGSGLAFCLIPKSSDPAHVGVTLHVGDCLKAIGANAVETTTCSSPEAMYKVLRSVPAEDMCAVVADSVATYSYHRPGEAFNRAFCLGPTH